MSEQAEWEIPTQGRPRPADMAFDLNAALSAVLSLRAEIPEDAFTAATLGTERAGNAVLIRDDGLVLTIGYLVTEAERIWLSTGRNAVQGVVTAYDFATGFGLVQALGRLGVPALPLGSTAPEAVTAGEYGYVDAAGRLLCRLDVVQADFSKVTAETRNALLIIEGTAAHPRDTLWQAFADAVIEITKHCGGSAAIVAYPDEPATD